MQYALLVMLWSLYGAFHSLLASTSLKRWMSRRMGGFFRYYRLLYNGIALAGLVGVLAFQVSLPEEPFWNFPVLRATGWLLVSAGLFIIVIALYGYNLGEFSGLSASTPTGGPGRLQEGGLLRHVRHPLYSGMYLLLWGYFLAAPLPSHLVMALILSVYIRTGIYFEERKLLDEFGDGYAAYRKRVPMLFPKLRFISQ